MIKLIASDLDGTLLRPGAQQPSPRALDLIRRLLERGILFAPASGRQYSNLRRMFAPFADKLVFICENGALAMYREERLSCTPIPRADGVALMRDILSHTNCEVLLSAPGTSYLSGRNRPYADHIVYVQRNTATIVDDVCAVEDDFIKISAFVKNNGAAEIAPQFIEKWGRRFNTAVAGAAWVDFTLADKGLALRAAQTHFGLQKEEMMAFGDNFNDVQMLESAGYPYVMESAHPDLRACGRPCADVEDVLEEFLRAPETFPD